MKDKKAGYQVVVVLSPKIEEKTRDDVLKKIRGVFDEAKLEGEKEEHLGMKELVYKVADFNRGDFWIFNIEGKKGFNFKDFNLMLNRENSIIRYLILRRS